jgi:PIN domain nuclease of toxin-antitoxin system
MRYLLDTHVLLWSFLESRKISEGVQAVMDDEGALVCYSPVSLWEIAIKYRLGKLDLRGHTPEELFEEINNGGFPCKNLENQTIISSYQLPLRHKDPFDRMLFWEAIQSDMVLLSSDRSSSLYKTEGLRVIR